MDHVQSQTRACAEFERSPGFDRCCAACISKSHQSQSCPNCWATKSMFKACSSQSSHSSSHSQLQAVAWSYRCLGGLEVLVDKPVILRTGNCFSQSFINIELKVVCQQQFPYCLILSGIQSVLLAYYDVEMQG